MTSQRPNKKYHYKIGYGDCPNCGKQIQRICVYKDGTLVGYLGIDCEWCGASKEAVADDIEFIDTKFCFAKPNKEVRVWRNDKK